MTARKPRLTDEEVEALREQLDDYMLGNPITARLVRERPLSKKHQAGMRTVEADRPKPISKGYPYAKRKR